ncbi:RICIN domain-containing protein [Streptomyces sp. NPDC018964]|uniref:RICIN domain-containing protein n=1 Tax=Streptomyces sp. NPDC018964 TaxID=3365058 RepID=UPI0037AD663C
MPRQHEPSAGETMPSVAVRRAVSVPAPGKDPGADLRPRTPEPAPAPAPAAAPEPEPDSAAGPDTSVPTASSPEPAPEPASESAPDPASGSAPGRRTGRRFRSAAAEPEAAGEGRKQEERRRRQTAEPDGAESEAAAGALLAGKGDGAGDTNANADTAADEPAPGRLRGPMVAAAALVGAVLICVPLLVLALSGDDDERTVETAPVGGTTLDPGTSDDLPAVDYQAESPSPSASSSSPEAKSDTRATSGPPPSVSVTADVEEKAAPRPDTKETAGGKATPKAEKPPAITARQLANALSTRVNAQLKNVATGKCADLPYFDKGSVDGPVSQFNCRPTTQDNQLWDLEVADADGGPQGASLFVIRNRKDGMCMDLPNYGSVAPGTKVTEYHCRPAADNQLWWLDPQQGGYRIRNAASDLCMSVVGGGSAGNDARLQVVRCGSGSSALRWSVVSVVKPS